MTVSVDFGDLCEGALINQRGRPPNDGDRTMKVGQDEGHEHLASLDIQQNESMVDLLPHHRHDYIVAVHSSQNLSRWIRSDLTAHIESDRWRHITTLLGWTPRGTINDHYSSIVRMSSSSEIMPSYGHQLPQSSSV
ncbi:hypothetical protein V6N13_101101 [Hibiscus sabdariffa]